MSSPATSARPRKARRSSKLRRNARQVAFLALLVVAFAAGFAQKLWTVETVAAADVADEFHQVG